MATFVSKNGFQVYYSTDCVVIKHDYIYRSRSMNLDIKDIEFCFAKISKDKNTLFAYFSYQGSNSLQYLTCSKVSEMCKINNPTTFTPDVPMIINYVEYRYNKKISDYMSNHVTLCCDVLGYQHLVIYDEEENLIGVLQSCKVVSQGKYADTLKRIYVELEACKTIEYYSMSQQGDASQWGERCQKYDTAKQSISALMK